MLDVERIKSFYDIEESNNGIRVSKKGSGVKGKIVHLNVGKVFLIFGSDKVNKKTSPGELQRFHEEGEIIITTVKELAKEVFEWDDETICLKANGYDLRTEAYLDEVLKEIGYLDTKKGWDWEKFEVTEQYDIWVNITGHGKVDCGKLVDGRYVAQYSYRSAIDDYCIVDYYFDRMPSREDILKVYYAEKIKDLFFLNPGSYMIKCEDCGQTKHWLDCNGDSLKDKIEIIKSQCCC